MRLRRNFMVSWQTNDLRCQTKTLKVGSDIEPALWSHCLWGKICYFKTRQSRIVWKRSPFLCLALSYFNILISWYLTYEISCTDTCTYDGVWIHVPMTVFVCFKQHLGPRVQGIKQEETRTRIQTLTTHLNFSLKKLKNNILVRMQ